MVRVHNLLPSLIHTHTRSALGYHAMYMRHGLPVLAFFRVEDLFVNFYPAISALLTQKAAYAIDKPSFFKKLTKEERYVCLIRGVHCSCMWCTCTCVC